MKFFKYIKAHKNTVALIIAVLFLTIIFETAQQLFYINHFNLNQNVTFYFLLKSQIYRWLIWVVLSFIIVWYLRSNHTNSHLTVLDVFKYAGLIMLMVTLNIFIISLSQLISHGESFTFKKFIFEYVQFYVFQKAPIYILGYIAITIILHLFFANKQLQIKIQNLSEVKKTNTKLYKQLSKNNSDNTTVLNIKIGNKRKIIPVTDIYWIEADDYCVKVHTNKEACYTMRSSLKALDDKLGNNFLRIHRKAIVNMNMVKELNLSNTPKLILRNDIKIPVSKSNLKGVKNFIG